MSESIDCRGVKYGEQGQTAPALEKRQSVQALVLVHRDRFREVCCPYLTKAVAGSENGLCSATLQKNTRVNSAYLPPCPFHSIEEPITNFVGTVRLFMQFKHWNVTDLAKASGIDVIIIQEIVDCKLRKPSTEVLFKLSKAFGRDIVTDEQINS